MRMMEKRRSKVLLVTRSFVREVQELLTYAAQHEAPFDFTVVIPADSHLEAVGATTFSHRRVLCGSRMRAAWYPPTLTWDVWRCRPDIVHLFEEFSGLIAFQTLFLNRLFGRRSKTLVYSAENLPQNMHPLFRRLRQYVSAHAHAALVCSAGVSPVMTAEGFRQPIEVFPLGVDTEKFAPASADALKTQLQLTGKFVLGYVGRLLEIKGVFLLLELMQRLPAHIHLLIIGSGPAEAGLRHAAAQAKLTPRLHFTGAVAYADLPHYLNCMDLGLVPSQTTPYWKEQFGRVIVELMSCGVPVLGSDSGSIPEVIGEAGAVFPENALAELARLVTSLLADEHQRRQFGQHGRERAVRCYSVPVMCAQILDMYSRLRNDAS